MTLVPYEVMSLLGTRTLAIAARGTLRNQVTGVELDGPYGSSSREGVLEVGFLMPAGTILDSLPPACPGNWSRYSLNASLQTGEFRGTLRLMCEFPLGGGSIFETQPVVLRRL